MKALYPLLAILVLAIVVFFVGKRNAAKLSQ